MLKLKICFWIKWHWNDWNDKLKVGIHAQKVYRHWGSLTRSKFRSKSPGELSIWALTRTRLKIEKKIREVLEKTLLLNISWHTNTYQIPEKRSPWKKWLLSKFLPAQKNATWVIAPATLKKKNSVSSPHDTFHFLRVLSCTCQMCVQFSAFFPLFWSLVHSRDSETSIVGLTESTCRGSSNCSFPPTPHEKNWGFFL